MDKKGAAHNRKVAVLRNKAAQTSKHDVIVWCDDDIILDPNWLENTVKYSKNNGWQVLGNKILNPDGTRCWDRSILNPHQLVDYETSEGHPHLYQTSGFLLVRKSVFDTVKWNEDRLVYDDKHGKIPEDIQFSIDLKAAGFVFSFNKDATVWHNDEAYTEWGNQTLLKSEIEKQTGMSFFPEPCNDEF